MSSSTQPSLTPDEIDDVLYFTRVNGKDDLKQTITELSQKYQCQPKDVVQAAIDPESGNSVLHYCAANGLADLLPTLLQYVAPTELHDATNGKAPATALINRTNQQGNTALHWGALNGHLEVVKLLVDAGADQWIKNSAGHLALFEAERAEKGDVVAHLLIAGGKEVEQTGTENQPTEEDVQEMSEETTEAGPSGDAKQGADVTMEEAGPS